MSRTGKHPHSAHFSLARSKHPLSAHVSHPLCAAAVGFREPPNKPAWLRETPYTTIPVFPTVTVTVISQYPAKAGIPLCTVQITFIFIGQTHKIWFLANKFAPVLRNTQTRFKLFWIGLRIRKAFGINRNCTFCVCLFSQILICDLWALGGFSFRFGFSFRKRWSYPFER